MTVEAVLLVFLYAFFMLGLFLGDKGVVSTFQNTTPHLAALVERNITVGYRFRVEESPDHRWSWLSPN